MKENKKYLISFLEMMFMIAIIICIFKFIVIPVKIEGNSMESTLHNESVALINKIGVKEENIHRFDVVVVYSDTLNEKIIKRVIGMPGDHIEFKNDVLYINGRMTQQDFLDKNFIIESKILYNASQFTEDFSADVGEGQYFVMGDNRLRSTDSRVLGTFSIDDIIGTEGIVIFPFNQIQIIG
jgi:signal peptidase I, bacterial type